MLDDMAVFIENLGVHVEGGTTGAWFRFPLNEEEIAERIGLNTQYEEYAIHDTENFPCDVEEYTSIEELNRIYELIQEFPEEVLDNLNDFISYYGDIEELADHIGDIICYSGCETMEDVAYHKIYEENVLGEIPPAFFHYIDCEAYGRDIEIQDYFVKTKYGMCEIKR
mgnify:FL=1